MRYARRVPRVPAALFAIAGVALLARLVVLDARVAHWDEGRVGYDVLRYAATGTWEYRPIVHGPFLAHVNRLVFEVLGPTDATMRLVPAAVGGLLPLSAWLYREHLADAEVVALALLLSVEPVLLYYSRFMRNDVLVAAFAFTALGCYLRLYDTGRHRYLYAGTAVLALAFTTKENAALYPVTVLGGLVLLLDHRLFLARGRREDWTDVLLAALGRVGRGLWHLRVPLVVAAVEFVVVLVAFYAPREAVAGGLGPWQALVNPAQLPDLVAAATVNPEPCAVVDGRTPSAYCDGAIERAFDSWVAGSHQDHAYLPYLGHFLRVLGVASGGLALLAVVGFLADRYRGGRPRDLVALGFYWGLASLVGYPIVMDIPAAWGLVHVVVPLAIPAAVGVALFVGWGRDALEDGDRTSAVLAALLVLLLVGSLPVVAVQTSYVAPQGEGNVLVQYAQPRDDMRPGLAAVRSAVRENGPGLDVVWYNEHFYVADESTADRLPAGGNWYHRLPMPWYLERYGAVVDSTDDPEALGRLVETERPPVVITRSRERGDVEAHLAGYRSYTYEFRQRGADGQPAEQLVIFVDEPDAAGTG